MGKRIVYELMRVSSLEDKSVPGKAFHFHTLDLKRKGVNSRFGFHRNDVNLASEHQPAVIFSTKVSEH